MSKLKDQIEHQLYLLHGYDRGEIDILDHQVGETADAILQLIEVERKTTTRELLEAMMRGLELGGVIDQGVVMSELRKLDHTHEASTSGDAMGVDKGAMPNLLDEQEKPTGTHIDDDIQGKYL